MKTIFFLLNIFVILAITQAKCLVDMHKHNREHIFSEGGSIVKVNEDGVMMHSFKMPNKTYTTNMIEMNSKLLVIDFGMYAKDAENAVRYAKSLGKTEIICLLTHDHFDHFGGYIAWKDYCTETVALSVHIDMVRESSKNPSSFSESGKAFVNNAKPVSPGEYKIDGNEVIYKNIKNVETEDFLLVVLPDQKAMFLGDIIVRDSHFFLADNHNIGNWIDFLKELRCHKYRNMFLGHGHPLNWAASKSYEENMEYLKFVRDIANTYKNKEDYVKQIINRFPDRYSEFIIGCPFGCGL